MRGSVGRCIYQLIAELDYNTYRYWRRRTSSRGSNACRYCGLVGILTCKLHRLKYIGCAQLFLCLHLFPGVPVLNYHRITWISLLLIAMWKRKPVKWHDNVSVNELSVQLTIVLSESIVPAILNLCHIYRCNDSTTGLYELERDIVAGLRCYVADWCLSVLVGSDRLNMTDIHTRLPLLSGIHLYLRILHIWMMLLMLNWLKRLQT